jgi:hypothetical protein
MACRCQHVELLSQEWLFDTALYAHKRFTYVPGPAALSSLAPLSSQIFPLCLANFVEQKKKKKGQICINKPPILQYAYGCNISSTSDPNWPKYESNKRIYMSLKSQLFNLHTTSLFRG